MTGECADQNTEGLIVCRAVIGLDALGNHILRVISKAWLLAAEGLAPPNLKMQPQSRSRKLEVTLNEAAAICGHQTLLRPSRPYIDLDTQAPHELSLNQRLLQPSSLTMLAAPKLPSFL